MDKIEWKERDSINLTYLMCDIFIEYTTITKPMILLRVRRRREGEGGRKGLRKGGKEGGSRNKSSGQINLIDRYDIVVKGQSMFSNRCI